MSGMRRLASSAVLLVVVSAIYDRPVPAAAPEPMPEDARILKARMATTAYKDSVELCDMEGLAWMGDLAEALAKAGKDKKLVFLEFTAGTNINGAYNHRAVFAKPVVKAALKPYTLVVLYVDAVPDKFFKGNASDEKRFAEGEANNQFEKNAFSTAAMPLCVILKPERDRVFQVVGRYEEARITNEEKFVDFLHSPLASEK